MFVIYNDYVHGYPKLHTELLFKLVSGRGLRRSFPQTAPDGRTSR